MGFSNAGSAFSGKKTPHRNSMGNRKKLERVMASKTSRTATDTKAPRAEKQKAETLSDEQIHKIAADATIDAGILAIFVNGYALECKRVSCLTQGDSRKLIIEKERKTKWR